MDKKVKYSDTKVNEISVTFTQDLIQDVGSLFNCPKLHDLVFTTPTGDEIAVAHKTILGARSTYWHKYFSSRTPPPSSTTSLSSPTSSKSFLSTLPLSDLSVSEDVETIIVQESPDAFLSILKYIYTNRFARVPLEILSSVVSLARRYDLGELVADATRKIEKKDKKNESEEKTHSARFLDAKRLPCGGEAKMSSAYPVVSFEVEKRIFHASPLVLMARSNYFSTMFCYRWSEFLSISKGDGEEKAPISIQTISAEDFNLILRFAHTGQIRLIGSDFDNLNKLLSLIEWGVFYQMKSFLSALSQLIYAHYVNPRSVCLIWNQAEDYPDQEMGELVEKCMEFFQREFIACTIVPEAKQNFFRLRKHLLKSSLDSGLISADYRLMAQAIREWASANAVRLGETPDSLEKQLLPPSTLFNLENRNCILGVGPRPNQLPRFLAAV